MRKVFIYFFITIREMCKSYMSFVPWTRLSTEKQELAALILSEINRKMFSVVWCP